MSTPVPHTVIFFSNGMAACCDREGKQIDEFQGRHAVAVAALAAAGYDRRKLPEVLGAPLALPDLSADASLTVAWPTKPGIWMGWIDGMQDWFPLQARLLKEYPPEVPHIAMPIIAQWPESDKSWPYTFQGCHPVKHWREPTDEELRKARHYYGIGD